jgi:phage terminase large subunit-like protein
VGSLFGWQRADGLRRFRTAYCAVPRKNGKSTLSAGIALYLLVADGEQGAEIYSAATWSPECLPAHAPERVDRAGRALDRPCSPGCLRRSGRRRGLARENLLRRPRPLGTTDVTALAWVFPPEHDDGLWPVLSRYFVPEEHLRKRAERDRVPYDLWARHGFIEATTGNVVDYGAIEQRILADSALFQVKEIAYRGSASRHW